MKPEFLPKTDRTTLAASQEQAAAQQPAGAADADAMAALHRQLAELKRENRILKIAVSELERVSERDTLTPLYNRRFFLSALHQRIARTRRYNEHISVIFVDVDGLKRINDSLGHAAGDYALLVTAQRLSGAIRTTDLAARIGGDEFGLILDNADEAAARHKTGQLTKLFSAEPLEYQGRMIQLSASFGVAILGPDMDEAAVMAMADADMYRGKAQRSPPITAPITAPIAR